MGKISEEREKKEVVGTRERRQDQREISNDEWIKSRGNRQHKREMKKKTRRGKMKKKSGNSGDKRGQYLEM